MLLSSLIITSVGQWDITRTLIFVWAFVVSGPEKNGKREYLISSLFEQPKLFFTQRKITSYCRSKENWRIKEHIEFLGGYFTHEIKTELKMKLNQSHVISSCCIIFTEPQDTSVCRVTISNCLSLRCIEASCVVI